MCARVPVVCVFARARVCACAYVETEHETKENTKAKHSQLLSLCLAFLCLLTDCLPHQTDVRVLCARVHARVLVHQNRLALHRE